jgi:hypothetical protein
VEAQSNILPVHLKDSASLQHTSNELNPLHQTVTSVLSTQSMMISVVYGTPTQKDHTGNKGGYMFLVNADEKPGQFYKGRVNNLCFGQRYEFSVYLANVCKLNTVRIKPNLLFEVRTTDGNDLLVELSLGEVVKHDTLTWKKYGLSFTATSSSVVLLMISHGLGEMGNGLVLDDIALRVCNGTGPGFCPSD